MISIRTCNRKSFDVNVKGEKFDDKNRKKGSLN